MILEALLDQLDYQTRVLDIRVGLFHTAVLSRHCGLAASLPRDALQQSPPLVKEPGALLNLNTWELARLVHSESLLEAAIGMATINSLLRVQREDCLECNAADLILEQGRGRDVAIIGHFPFVPRIREAVRQLWVIEKNPQPGDRLEVEARTLLPQAELVAITGTAFTNKSIEDLLQLCDPRAYVLILGDSAPLSPLLFDLGINAICGTWVENPELAMSCVSQGANFRQIRGTRRLTMLKS